jgi:NAD+ synthase
MRDYREETEKRIAFIRARLAESRTDGIVYGNSGGKDSALTGILCKLACDNTVGICLPCESKRNFGEDMADGLAVAEKFRIETRVMDLTATKQTLTAALGEIMTLNSAASTNINPRLRMIALYAAAAAENRLVAGTGNRSERYMGYFTKWGDGACDFNPIGDLNVTEIYEFLRYLGAPENIITKAPSAGLFEGQTDEQEMGVTYAAIDRYLDGGEVSEGEKAVIDRFHSRSEHKRKLPPVFGEE